MVKYVEGKFDEDYIQTLGVNFMEKTIRIKKTNITFSIWDLGGQREFISMLPLVCNDAVAILCGFGRYLLRYLCLSHAPHPRPIPHVPHPHPFLLSDL